MSNTVVGNAPRPTPAVAVDVPQAGEFAGIFETTLVDAWVAVSVFVAVTVLGFSYVQYRTRGALVEKLRANSRFQPLFGALLGLTPGCGGAIVMMPLYLRGTVGFGTVVATLVATAGDSAFVILVLAPEAALYAYGITFVVAVAFGYAVEYRGLGVNRLDRAVVRLERPQTDGGSITLRPTQNAAQHEYAGDTCCEADAAGTESARAVALRPLSHLAHALWWAVAAVGLLIGVWILAADAEAVAMSPPSGIETAVGLTGASLSIYLYLVGRHYIGTGEVARAREDFRSAYDTLQHTAMETSFVTIWVVAALALYEYSIAIFAIDVAAGVTAAGILAPIGAALLGIVPGCGPQIVLAGVYANGGIPFSALVANAISQDGDALFPLLAMDRRAAIVASVYTTIPALVTGIALHFLWGPVLGLPQFGFGVA